MHEINKRNILDEVEAATFLHPEKGESTEMKILIIEISYLCFAYNTGFQNFAEKRKLCVKDYVGETMNFVFGTFHTTYERIEK